MATAYTSLLGLALPVTGELQGTWGTTVNDSITSLLDTAVAGTTTLSADTDVTLSTTTGAANQARQAILLCSGARTVLRTITAPAQSKIYTVINATTGGFSVKLVGVGPTTGVTIVAGESALVAWNGSDFIKISNTGGAASFTNVTVSGTTTLSGLTASTALALNGSKEVVSVTNTGTGNNVLSASPTLTGTISAAAATLSGNLTLSGGTANGVLYLDGSKVATSGTDLVFNATGLGIGTSSPVSRLTVQEANRANSTNLANVNIYTTTAQAADVGATIALGGMFSVSQNAPFGSIRGGKENSTDNNYNGYLAFQTIQNASVLTERMRLDSSGNLGIGLTAASRFDAGQSAGSRIRFDLSSASTVSVNYSNYAGSTFLDATHNAVNHIWTNAGSELMRLTSTGLGIGTTNPAARLDVRSGATTFTAQIDSTGINTYSATTSTSLTNTTLQLVGGGASGATTGIRLSQGGSFEAYFGGVQESGGAAAFVWQGYSGSAYSERMRLDSSGNLGLGVTPGTWAAAAKALDFVYPAFGMDADGAAFMSFNARNTTGSTWVYKTTDEAALFTATAGGEFTWRRAASGTGGDPISFTQAMTLDASGQLSVGVVLAENSTGVYLLPTGEMRVKDATENGTSQISIYNTNTTNDSEQFFVAMDGANVDIGNRRTDGGALKLFTNNTERMRLDFSGNLGLGVTPSAWGGSGVKAFDVGTGASFAGSGSDAGMIANAYFNGTNWIYKTSSLSVRYQQIIGTGAHAWFTAPSGTAGNAITFTQAMTLDASSRLLIGTTTLGLGSNGNTVLTLGNGTNTVYSSIKGSTVELYSAVNATEGYIGTFTNHPFLFYTNNIERARITSGGDLLVGTTSAGGNGATIYSTGVIASVWSSSSSWSLKNSEATSGTSCIDLHRAVTTGDPTFQYFGTEATFTTRGSITYNRAGGLVAYNTTSDYRAKDIIGPVQNVGATIDALKVYEGVMKGATRSRPMLVAHEAQEHAPYAVSGVKDEVNEDGTPKFQQMDVSSLVPLLLAEIQSLRTRVAALEAK